MNQNTSGRALAGVDDAVVARATKRALGRRQAVYEDEVRRLLDAGLAVMRQSGTTKSPRVGDIVEAAGLSRDAFYRHFASKEDLVAAIVDAGAQRLVSYLSHMMAKHSDPMGQIQAWIEGIMSQADNAEVASSTRAVLWNGGRVGDHARPEAITSNEALSELITGPLIAIGSKDPDRDATVITHATMGLMRDLLWRCVRPTRADVEHLVHFCTAAVDHPTTKRKQ